MKIVYVVAMVAEAAPFVEHFNVTLQEGFFAPLPCLCYKTEINGNELYVVLNGQQHGSDLVGCEAASVATLSAIQKINPDLVINSGTCGAFKKNGANIADVYLGNAVMFHDRRVPGDDAWGTQALGNYPVYNKVEELATALNFKTGKVTTGSSLDMQPCDLAIIEENRGELKDMEGAAVAFVCSLFNTPVLFVKSVTDLCDGGAETFEEFMKNLGKASDALKEANIRIIEYLTSSKQLTINN